MVLGSWCNVDGTPWERAFWSLWLVTSSAHGGPLFLFLAPELFCYCVLPVSPTEILLRGVAILVTYAINQCTHKLSILSASITSLDSCSFLRIYYCFHILAAPREADPRSLSSAQDSHPPSWRSCPQPLPPLLCLQRGGAHSFRG